MQINAKIYNRLKTFNTFLTACVYFTIVLFIGNETN